MEDTIGISEMVKYLLMTSSVAVVPARRALVKAAAGLWANAIRAAKNMRSRKASSAPAGEA